MTTKKPVGKYPIEVRDRTVRMVQEHQHEYPSQWKAIESIAAKVNINAQTLRNWVNRAEIDTGQRPGITTDERAKIKALETREQRTPACEWNSESGIGFLRGGARPPVQDRE